MFDSATLSLSNVDVSPSFRYGVLNSPSGPSFSRSACSMLELFYLMTILIINNANGGGVGVFVWCSNIGEKVVVARLAFRVNLSNKTVFPPSLTLALTLA